MRTVKVGLSGWSMSMAQYPDHYPVVEVQHTFYQPPPDKTLLGWRALVPAGFEFTLKAWQLITHATTSSTYRRLKRPLSLEERAGAGGFKDTAIVQLGWERTRECARLLNATAILFQCPASFRPTPENVACLRAFFTRIDRPAGVRLLWEPRGEWPAARLRRLCGDLDLTHVVDPFVNRTVTREPTYYRLHGLGGTFHAYTPAQLEELRALIPARGETYVLFNNVPRLGDSKRFIALLERDRAPSPRTSPHA